MLDIRFVREHLDEVATAMQNRNHTWDSARFQELDESRRVSAEEILTEKEPDFDMDLDPKSCWAMRHRELFPVEINRAPYEIILRVPEIGVISARRIVRMRRNQFVSPDDVKRAGAVWKRAKHFVTCGGKYDGMGDADTGNLRKALLSKRAGRKMMQMSLFSGQV